MRQSEQSHRILYLKQWIVSQNAGISIAVFRRSADIDSGNHHVGRGAFHGMDTTLVSNRPIAAELNKEITATQQQLLHLIEDLTSVDSLTDHDRDQLTFEAGTLCAELRACLTSGA